MSIWLRQVAHGMACSGQISSWLHCDLVAAALQVMWTDLTTLKVADPLMRMTVVSFSDRTRPSQNRNTSMRRKRLESALRSSRGLHWSSRRCKRCLVGTVSSGSNPRRSARNWLCWRKTRELSNPSIHRCRPYKCQHYMLADFAICLDHAAPYHNESLLVRQVDCAGTAVRGSKLCGVPPMSQRWHRCRGLVSARLLLLVCMVTAQHCVAKCYCVLSQSRRLPADLCTALVQLEFSRDALVQPGS